MSVPATTPRPTGFGPSPVTNRSGVVLTLPVMSTWPLAMIVSGSGAALLPSALPRLTLPLTQYVPATTLTRPVHIFDPLLKLQPAGHTGSPVATVTQEPLSSSQ